ncbi:TetR family transcriptional regulator [Kineosporia succinea]|uniref:AcrR family transcriptional regulator n=1 Tax=Kineosporia succinea TaxID=84632 RepID=A0ABT9P9Y0_9ACTN|nr:TetR family transcriptional regulator [Kineosporia succinea]MDP9829506.1 AcrR family transcriptional regulator [Kineosporia succinea]
MAIRLFLAHGYDAVTVERIAAECGVGRATFFRYFATKADVVFFAFDAVLETMREGLGQAPARRPPNQVVADCVIESTRRALANPVWLDRFVLLDTAPGLRAGTAEHWASWTAQIRAYLDHRLDPERADASLRNAAFAGAVTEAYVESFRRPGVRQDDPEGFIADLEAWLRPLCRSAAAMLRP